MNYTNVIEHITGPQNVWADMIRRWAGNHDPVATAIKRVRAETPGEPNQHGETTEEAMSEVTEPIISTLRPLDDANSFGRRSTPSLRRSRRLTRRPEPNAPTTGYFDSMVAYGYQLKLLDSSSDYSSSLIVGPKATVAGPPWRNTSAEFSRSNTSTPRSRPSFAKRNGVLHFDYLSMGESFGDSKYILVLKDHASHYCELVVADTADSSVTVEALLAWHARFGVPPTWISDQGSHFKNEVVAELSRRLRTQQEFTPAYCPWINGSVERVNRDILQVIRTMILEYKTNHTDWPYLMPMVQASLNHTAVPSLGNKAPVELFTGLPCLTPLREFYLPDAGELKKVPEIDKIDEFLADLRASIQEMHRAVQDKRLKQRLLNKKRERGENVINFTEGDYVLRSRVDEKSGNKLLVTWVGPYRVLRADAHSFLIQHLITGAELDVHASRLKFYADASLDVTEELREHISSQGIVLAIEKLKEHRWNDQIRDYEVLF
ncbi:hypothetical protein PR002_g29306 [Phytophthora rubi]|uniref:Integrase catalytic domain-containing protein n=1 Tax=Phytophthora rubi TaxID=129364 RepID=A0A6A3H2S8_9STRA|nr:hypothetical protein PR002_g29306 [Phytophthora rubi]